MSDAACFVFLTNALRMLKAHPDAESEYYTFAEQLSERLLVNALSIRKNEGARIDGRIVQIADRIAELKRLKESRPKCDGEKK